MFAIDINLIFKYTWWVFLVGGGGGFKENCVKCGAVTLRKRSVRANYCGNALGPCS